MSGPIPARVDGAAKAVLLDVIDEAIDAGWSLTRICGVLELDRQRAWRWQQRRLADRLDDLAPGGNPIHGILAWEEHAVIELFEEWGSVDLSHRKLAHRGSYLERVWVSPSTVDRILARHGLRLAGEPRPAKSVKKPWPEWVEWSPNQLWCWDMSQFERCKTAKYAYAIVDIVTRKWITSLLSAEPTSVTVKVLFTQALRAEAILDDLDDRLANPERIELDDETLPVLLAVSDNGTEMTSHSTRAFMASMSVAQHFGRPGTPTDQAWIESLWSHVKHEWPHLCRISDPAVLAAELERVQVHYNSVRLHEGIGYVTPNDEHEGRGDKIRAARRDGLAAADAARRAHHRALTSVQP
ncbi:MAG TPA: integrase core domain-containing protein [Solirubrobacterales bacterium]|nr:integrase core domain-containing protein [Solirubrobacterales bacterium]